MTLLEQCQLLAKTSLAESGYTFSGDVIRLGQLLNDCIEDYLTDLDAKDLKERDDAQR